MRGTLLCALVVVLGCAWGCGSSSNGGGTPSTAAWSFPEHQFVVDEVTVPGTGQEAQQLGFDLDHDGTVDNQFGELVAALAGAASGTGPQEAIQTSIDSGNTLILLSIYAEDVQDSSSSNLWSFLAESVALTDGPQAGATFTVDATGGPQSAYLGGRIEGGFATYGGDDTSVTLKFPLSGDVVVELPIRSVRVELDVSADGTTLQGGRIGGAITEADLNAYVVPAAATSLDDALAANCSSRNGGTTGGNAECGCIEGSGTATIQSIFDSDDDCTVTVTEVSDNGLISALLSGDIVLPDGTAALSLGFGFHAIQATFTHAPPPSQ